jgi:hypothetical protein
VFKPSDERPRAVLTAAITGSSKRMPESIELEEEFRNNGLGLEVAGNELAIPYCYEHSAIQASVRASNHRLHRRKREWDRLVLTS